MSLTAGLQSAVSALNAVQAQIQITSSNIANVNTPGYSRKAVDLTSREVDGRSVGVSLGDVRRTVDETLVRELRTHIAKLGGFKVQDAYLTRSQNLFGTLESNSSLSHRLAKTGAAFDAVGTTPDSPATRSAAVQQVQFTSDRLNTLTDSLQALRRDADQEISVTVADINRRLEDIANLDQRVQEARAIGEPVPDIEDQRDQLIKELAEDIGIQYFERDNGGILITTESGRTLLDNEPVPLSFTPASLVAATTTHLNGLGGVLYGATSLDVTDELRSGKLGALLEVRDETLVDLQAQIDELAQVLRTRVNALHNDGTAYPPPTGLTGLRSVAATDAPAMTGEFRVSVTDATGVVVETLDIDLAALAPANIGALVTAINGMANATAAINADGQVAVSATGGNRIALNELDSSVTTGTRSIGMAHFLGLNNLLDDGIDYDRYVSGRLTSDSTALGLTGTLTFDIAGAATNVAYAAGDSLDDIATAVSAALAGQNIAASVVRESQGYRLQIQDADGDNFFLSDSGGLTAQANLRPGLPGLAGRLEVRPDILTDPDQLARGELSDAAGLAAGDIGISAGNGDIAVALGQVFTNSQSFSAAGGFAGGNLTLESYATNILANNAALSSAAQSDLTLATSFQATLESQAAAISGVNLDEELAQITILQNSYAASARVTTVISELLDTLIQTVR